MKVLFRFLKIFILMKKNVVLLINLDFDISLSNFGFLIILIL